MAGRIHFVGPAKYRIRSAQAMARSILEVSARRMCKGPKRPTWTWFVEVCTEMLKRQVAAAFEMEDLNEARRYLDSISLGSPALTEVNIAPVTEEKFHGNWFTARDAPSSITLLYLHGGGYSFYPRAYASFIAMITRAARCRTFALDYRLSPEHRFPAQLDDALNAYRWLLNSNVDPSNLVFAGDSAGGNLTLALLLAARDANLPLPALAVALSPPIDFDTEYPSMLANPHNDWISLRALRQWADWFCEPAQRRNPLVSPVLADLRGLPPIYLQAGRAELLYDSIQLFVEHARAQGADVVFDTWEDMNHDFQIFGSDAPQSSAALRKIGDVINARLAASPATEVVSARDRQPA